MTPMEQNGVPTNNQQQNQIYGYSYEQNSSLNNSTEGKKLYIFMLLVFLLLAGVRALLEKVIGDVWLDRGVPLLDRSELQEYVILLITSSSLGIALILIGLVIIWLAVNAYLSKRFGAKIRIRFWPLLLSSGTIIVAAFLLVVNVFFAYRMITNTGGLEVGGALLVLIFYTPLAYLYSRFVQYMVNRYKYKSSADPQLHNAYDVLSETVRFAHKLTYPLIGMTFVLLLLISVVAGTI